MPVRTVGLPEDVPDEFARGLAAIRAVMQVPDAFPADVGASATAAAAAPRLPDLDRTDLPLVTLDPEGSRDLDQAMHLTRGPGGTGYVVSYAIADVAAFVTAGDPVDLEAHRRGETLYAPDHRTPLHPAVLSEGAASLLPDQVRPALLWTISLDASGELGEVAVARARVRSTEQLTYTSAQAEIDGGSARETLALLQEVGQLREALERARGGVSLQIPEQEILPVPDPPGFRLQYRTPLPAEGWNAQISLLTGMGAARLMLAGQVGLLRTMPPADAESLRRLRRTARGLHLDWPDGVAYPDFVRSLDPQVSAQAAMLNACTTLFRGAGYLAFHGQAPEHAEHSALATNYAHVTAPLRRLVDRYAGEICVALCAGRPVPEWTLAALDALPAEMMAADRRAKKYERAIVDLMEVCLLLGRVGETFTGTVIEVDRDGRRGTLMLVDPAVEAKVTGTNLPLGAEILVRLTAADLTTGGVTFAAA